ncbi:RNA 3'-terminal phosphate cyclase [Bienertia sinuspersici]
MAETENNSNYYNYDYRNQDDGVSLVPPPPQLTRAPSLFSRVSSFNFSQYYSESPHVPPQDEPESTVTLQRAPSLLYRVASFKFCWATREADGEGKMGNDHHHQQQQQQKQRQVDVAKETMTFKGEDEKPVKKTTASSGEDSKVMETTAFRGEDSEAKETTAIRGEDEQVDSKADDFINRFKQQLKMQRLESMIRYRLVLLLLELAFLRVIYVV